MAAIKNIINLWHRISWRPNAATWAELLLILAVYPLMLWANPTYFTEDGWVENIQLLILFAAVIIAWRAKQNRPLFVFVGLMIIFMIMRETNLLRGYFCRAYLPEGALCRWKSFSYGYLAEGFRLLFVICAALYFCRQKLWKTVFIYLCRAPIFIWDIAIFCIMALGGTFAEFACIDNEIMEESCELICYLALVNCIYRYSKVSVES